MVRTWVLGDACGVLVVAPVLLTWVASGFVGLHRRELLEAGCVILVLAVLAELSPQRDVPFIVFPVLLWAALRFGPRGAATAILVVCSITVWNTAQSDGPFVRDSITDSLLATQLFIAASAITSLVLGAVTAERTRAEAAQRALADEQAALRRVATLVAGDPSPSRVFDAVTEEVGRLLGLPGANVMQLDGPGRATVVGAWSEDGKPRFAVGATLQFDGDTLVPKVARSGRPQRVERYDQAGGTFAAVLRDVGYRAGVAAPVSVSGALWGVLAAVTTSEEPLPAELEQRLCDFADLVAQALANADAYEKLAASRARVVEVGDAERRRLERNLHDGAQQRLVSVALGLSVVGSKLESDPQAARAILSTAQEDLAAGLAELRELARGIHPAVLTERGLGPALRSLLARAPVPVEIVESAGAAPAPQHRGGGILRGRRGGHERRQVRERLGGDRRRPALQRPRLGDRRRRRHRRRRPSSRLRARRPRGARGIPQRPSRGGQPEGPRHACHRRDPPLASGRLTPSTTIVRRRLRRFLGCVGGHGPPGVRQSCSPADTTSGCG